MDVGNADKTHTISLCVIGDDASSIDKDIDDIGGFDCTQMPYVYGGSHDTDLSGDVLYPLYAIDNYQVKILIARDADYIYANMIMLARGAAAIHIDCRKPYFYIYDDEYILSDKMISILTAYGMKVVHGIDDLTYELGMVKKAFMHAADNAEPGLFDFNYLI